MSSSCVCTTFLKTNSVAQSVSPVYRIAPRLNLWCSMSMVCQLHTVQHTGSINRMLTWCVSVWCTFSPSCYILWALFSAALVSKARSLAILTCESQHSAIFHPLSYISLLALRWEEWKCLRCALKNISQSTNFKQCYWWYLRLAKS